MASMDVDLDEKLESTAAAVDDVASSLPETHEKLLPNMRLVQLQFTATSDASSAVEKQQASDELLAAVKQFDMLPFYTTVCQALKWQLDGSELTRMQTANATRLREFDAKIDDAVENLGESELRDAHLQKAEYLLQIGDKEKCLAAYKQTYEKTVGAGSKLDLLLTLVRVGFFFGDAALAKRQIEQAKLLVEEGGDWDRRTRLKDYEAYYLVTQRKFEEAADLFLETMTTFNATELMSLDSFVQRTTICALVALKRATLRKKVEVAPELVAPRQNGAAVVRALDALLCGNYQQYFEAIVDVGDWLRRDHLVARHASFAVRELRVRGYAQMLSSYRSVRMPVMAAAFGVSVDFIDQELSRFIALGRLPCKIDRVGLVIEMRRPDDTAALYQTTLKQGDLLLNRIQKLSRVINM